MIDRYLDADGYDFFRMFALVSVTVIVLLFSVGFSMCSPYSFYLFRFP